MDKTFNKKYNFSNSKNSNQNNFTDENDMKLKEGLMQEKNLDMQTMSKNLDSIESV